MIWTRATYPHRPEPHIRVKYIYIHMYTGAIDIDSSLISANSKLTAKEDIISMDNGCVCCTVRGDLVDAFKKLAAREDKYDAVLIETTGAFLFYF